MSEKLLTIDARAAIVYDVQGCNSGDADGCLYGKNPETWQTMRCQLSKKKKRMHCPVEAHSAAWKYCEEVHEAVQT
jgi:hypothetical protein